MHCYTWPTNHISHVAKSLRLAAARAGKDGVICRWEIGCAGAGKRPGVWRRSAARSAPCSIVTCRVGGVTSPFAGERRSMDGRVAALHGMRQPASGDRRCQATGGRRRQATGGGRRGVGTGPGPGSLELCVTAAGQSRCRVSVLIISTEDPPPDENVVH